MDDEVTRRTRTAQMIKEEALARTKQREDAEHGKQFSPTAGVRAEARRAAAIIHDVLDRHPDRMAPLLVGQTDQERVRALLAEDMGRMLREVADGIGAVDSEELPA